MGVLHSFIWNTLTWRFFADSHIIIIRIMDKACFGNYSIDNSKGIIGSGLFLFIITQNSGRLNSCAMTMSPAKPLWATQLHSTGGVASIKIVCYW